jgi:hypothetical protein
MWFLNVLVFCSGRKIFEGIILLPSRNEKSFVVEFMVSDREEGKRLVFVVGFVLIRVLGITKEHKIDGDKR